MNIGNRPSTSVAVLRLRLAFACIALVAAAAPFSTRAQGVADYPNKPIRMVIPFAPGGATDIIARILAQQLGKQLGQSVVVDNKGGANGNIAAEYVAKSPADGYTILYNTSSIAASPALYKTLNYDVMNDFAPVALTSTVPLVLSVNPSVPAKNVQEFVAYVKSNPNTLSYGSAGIGNVTHLSAHAFLQKLHLVATNVPYRGSGPSVIGTAGGETAFNFEPLNASLPFIKGKRLNALAVTTLKRVNALPNVPTVDETVIPGFEAGAWQGILVPAKTPKAIIAKLNAEVMKALAVPEVRAKLEEQGAVILGSTPAQYEAYLRTEIDRWGQTIKSLGVTLE